MREIRLDELLEKIHEEILKRAGKGFTIELNAEITKYEVYKRKAHPFPFLVRASGLGNTIKEKQMRNTFQNFKEKLMMFTILTVLNP
jgi:hypothetical protein